MKLVRLAPFASLACLACLASLARAANRGDGTAYSGPGEVDKTGKNACQFETSSLGKWNTYYCALNEADWDQGGGLEGVCGKCIEACGAAGCVIVKIVDLCPSWACDKGNVDFSTVALEAATGYDWDRKPITWSYVNCGLKTSDIESISDDATDALSEIESMTVGL